MWPKGTLPTSVGWRCVAPSSSAALIQNFQSIVSLIPASFVSLILATIDFRLWIPFTMNLPTNWTANTKEHGRNVLSRRQRESPCVHISLWSLNGDPVKTYHMEHVSHLQRAAGAWGWQPVKDCRKVPALSSSCPSASQPYPVNVTLGDQCCRASDARRSTHATRSAIKPKVHTCHPLNAFAFDLNQARAPCGIIIEWKSHSLSLVIGYVKDRVLLKSVVPPKS